MGDGLLEDAARTDVVAAGQVVLPVLDEGGEGG
jgi:hypothetical protein